MSWLTGLDELKGDRALDVGTGSGRFAHDLADRFTAVVAIDIPEALARATPHPFVRFTPMDAESLVFPDASFDLVGISWSLHHLANPTRVLVEMARVLKPGGAFVIVEPFVAETGTNQDLHTAAHLLVAEADCARGLAHFPLFKRMQIGSVIQGLGLERIAFHPLLEMPEEADWDLPRCQAAGKPWANRLEGLATDETMTPSLRERAKVLAAKIWAEGVRTTPTMRTFGFKPAEP